MKKEFFLKRFYKMLIDARWFFTFTASGMATIIGISLTFGLNACRESRKQNREMTQLLERTVDNLQDRTLRIMQQISILNEYDSIMVNVSARYKENPASLTDSTVNEFMDAVGTSWYMVVDRTTEHIFINSYDNWKVLGDVSLTTRIGLCYDQLNYLEKESNILYDAIDDVVRECNRQYNILDKSDYEFVKTLLDYPDFQYALMQHELKLESLDGLVKSLETNVDYVTDSM